MGIDGKMTSFEKETESLYAAGEVVEAAPAVATMSSRWNADLCGSLDAAPNTPSPTTLALSPMIMVKPEEVTGQHVQAVSQPLQQRPGTPVSMARRQQRHPQAPTLASMIAPAQSLALQVSQVVTGVITARRKRQISPRPPPSRAMWPRAGRTG